MSLASWLKSLWEGDAQKTERVADANPVIQQTIAELNPCQSRWVEVPEGRIYLRRAQHPGIGETIDIPNIVFDEEARGKGAFTRYLREIEIEAQRAGLDGVYVENIFNPRLEQFLRRHGYDDEPAWAPGPPCLYKRFSNVDRTDEIPNLSRRDVLQGLATIADAQVLIGGEDSADARLRLRAKLKKDFPEREVKMADTDNELQRLAEANGAMFVRTAAGTGRADDKDGIVIVRDAMSIAGAARLHCEDHDLVPSTPLEALTHIVKEYAPYDAMPEFRVGFDSHARGFYGNPYDADSVAAQAWDRGLEAAARYARTVSTDLRELDTAGARLSAETGIPYTPAARGDTVAGVYRESLALTSGRAAVIDTGVSFALVPWSSDLERQRGRHISGVAHDDGGIAWNFDRKRGLEI